MLIHKERWISIVITNKTSLGYLINTFLLWWFKFKDWRLKFKSLILILLLILILILISIHVMKHSNIPIEQSSNHTKLIFFTFLLISFLRIHMITSITNSTTILYHINPTITNKHTITQLLIQMTKSQIIND